MAAGSSSESPAFLETIEGEISFFRSIMRARPIGMHRQFHVLAMRTAIHKDTGHWVPVEDIWEKLRVCYDIDALDAIDVEAEGYESPRSSKSTPVSIKSPSPTENLMKHPYFREEFTLPWDPSFEAILSARRMSHVPSPPSSPEPASPASKSKATRFRKRNGKSKASMAGLVGGESDSSDLTDSGEEGFAPSTVTDGETLDGEDEDTEMQDPVPDPTTTKTGRARKSTKKALASRARGAAVSSSGRPTKKRKR